MTIALVANAAVAGANGGTTGAINTTGATLLVVAISESAGGQVTVSDNKSNTWTVLTGQDGSQPDSRIYYVANPTVGAGHTFTSTGGSTFSVLSVAAFSGVVTTLPFDQQNGSSAAPYSNTTAKPGSITPTQDNEVVVCGFGTVSDPGTLTIDSGFAITNQTPFTGGTNYGGALAYLIQSTAAAVNPEWGFTGTVNGSIVIASFKAAVVVSAAQPLPMRISM